MLAQAVRNNLKDINNLKMRIKPVESFETNDAQVEPGIQIETVSELEDYEIEIVDNPNEVIVEFPVVTGISLEEKLPFFKSITCKLAKIY